MLRSRYALFPCASRFAAIVSVTFDNALVVHDIKVIEGADKLFVAMPSRKTPEGEYIDIAHPIISQMRDALETSILEKYQSALLTETEQAEMPADPTV